MWCSVVVPVDSELPNAAFKVHNGGKQKVSPHLNRRRQPGYLARQQAKLVRQGFPAPWNPSDLALCLTSIAFLRHKSTQPHDHKRVTLWPSLDNVTLACFSRFCSLCECLCQSGVDENPARAEPEPHLQYNQCQHQSNVSGAREHMSERPPEKVFRDGCCCLKMTRDE